MKERPLPIRGSCCLSDDGGGGGMKPPRAAWYPPGGSTTARPPRAPACRAEEEENATTEDSGRSAGSRQHEILCRWCRASALGLAALEAESAAMPRSCSIYMRVFV